MYHQIQTRIYFNEKRKYKRVHKCIQFILIRSMGFRTRYVIN